MENAAMNAHTNPADQDDLLRIEIYNMLAHLCRQAPEQSALEFLANLDVDTAQTFQRKTMASAWPLLKLAAQKTTLLSVEEEYQDVFIGIGRAQSVIEPEDHISALLEVMAMLVEGGDEHLQQTFFNRHLSQWCEKFCTDLKAAKSAVFYTAVGELAWQFLTIEKTRFLESQ